MNRTLKSPLAHLLAVALLLLVPNLPAIGQETRTVDSEIKALVNALKQDRTLVVEEIPIRTESFLPAFYEQRAFGPAWTEVSNFSALIDGLLRLSSHGLDPGEFFVDDLVEKYDGAADDPAARAKIDLLLTDAAARLLGQLWFGKVDPVSLDTDWNYTQSDGLGDPVAKLQQALTDKTLAALIKDSELRHPYYLSLKAALRNYREVASSGGWPTIATEGAVIKPGTRDPRVAAIRKRITLEGAYTPVPADDPTLYDEGLVAAVRAFQSSAGLAVDGVIGKATLEVMNTPVTQRIDQIRANLERARWVLRDLGEDFVAVNIAGFYVRVVRGGETRWESPVIVGKPYHKTPVFRGTMSYLVINPDWTVPRSIILNEIAPQAAADPQYLEKHNFHLVDNAREPIDPSTVDWTAITPSNLNFLVVQGPGERNALGQVKFMFPNKHAVYLHDTPSRDLFSRSDRTFSHGCIRVKDPLDLADLLLTEKPGWSREAIDEIVSGGELTRVNLEQSLPVMILYWTVDPDLAGNVRFYKDVYGRDAAILAALDNTAT